MPGLRSAVRATVLAVGMPLLATATAPAQQAPPVSETLDVQVVNVDVSVVDKDGMPVSGIPRESFQLFQNQKQKIKFEYFSEMSESGDAVPVSLAIYFDEYQLRADNRDRLVEEMLPGLDSLLSTHPLPVLIATYDGEFEIVQHFAINKEATLAALKSLIGTPTDNGRLDIMNKGPQASVDQAFTQARGNNRDRRIGMASFDSVLGELRGYAQQVYADTERSLRALSAFVRILAPEPGRKLVIHASDGLALRPLDSAMSRLQSLISGHATTAGDTVSGGTGQSSGTGGGLGDGDLVQRDFGMEMGRMQQQTDSIDSDATLDALAADANTYRVTFFPIKAPPGTAASAGRSGRESVELSNVRESLEQLGEKTSGEAFTTERGVADLLQAVNSQLRHGYSLGFTLDKPPEAPLVPLRVKVKGKGLQVRHRQSYAFKDFETKLFDQTIAAVVLDSFDNPHALELETVDQTAVEGAVRVQVALSFPIQKVGLSPSDGLFQADCRVVALVLDPQSGQLMLRQQLTVPLQIPEADIEAARASFFRAAVPFDLPQGDFQIALGFWDGVARTTSFVQHALTVE